MATHPEWVELGYIAGAFGIKGEVRVHVHGSAHNSVLEGQTQCGLKPSERTNVQGDWEMHPVASVKAHGQELVMRFRAIRTRDQAEALRGYLVGLPREAFPEPEEEDTFYWVDLIGCTVYFDPELECETQASPDAHETLPRLGVVREVSENGVHAILHVCPQTPEGEWVRNSKGRFADRLIPFVEALVPAVNISQKYMITNYPVDEE